MFVSFNDSAAAKIAFSRMKEIPENFYFYEMGLVEAEGHPSSWNTIEITGCVMGQYEVGGEYCRPIESTQQTFYVSRDEVIAKESENEDR